MTLTNRLSAFFLAALAAVLVAFSFTLYALAYSYLQRQIDERLEAALDTLAAAAEISPGGVEWEPRERDMRVGSAVRWAVTGEDGAVVGHSSGLLNQESSFVETWNDAEWKAGGRRVQPAEYIPDGEPSKHRYLDVNAAVSRAPARQTLRWLAAALAGTSGVTWLMALLAGRWICRRALRPVADMAARADAIRAVDREARLPVPPTGDELAALGRAFNGLLDRLHEANERQRRFTGDASHQLRTPLAALLGQAEVSLRYPRSAEEYRTTLQRVFEQAQHLRQVAEMLLYLARADADAIPAELEATDLAAWLPAWLARWADHPRVSDLKLEAPAGPVTARVQAPLLGQLLDNLLDNACKYSEPGTPILISLKQNPSTIALAVEDQGDGIAAEDLPHLFEPFYRSEAARKSGRAGVGLGLAVARRIASLFGGTLAAAARGNSGSRFCLTLPADGHERVS